MNKNTLVTFIEKYNLQGAVESVKIVSDGKTLKTSFVTEDKTMAGSVTAKAFPLEECELSIFDTTKLKGFLKILDDDIKISLDKTDDDTLTGIFMSDDNTEVNFMLSDPSVIPAAPKVKEIKDFDVEIPIDESFIDRFTKAKNSLPEVDSFTLMMNKKGDKLELIIGYSSVNSNRVKVEIKPTPEKDKLDKPISFNANYFKDILNKNRESTGAVFKIASAGISQITFSTSEFDSNYYLIKKDIEA
jgi:hypothetical protein